MSVDLDEVTCKFVSSFGLPPIAEYSSFVKFILRVFTFVKQLRVSVEEALNMDLQDYRKFIDEEMLTILGQLDAPTKIYDYLYLGSEWNASNYEELKMNG